MIEQFIAGRELTVGILGDDALPVGEIIPKHEIYDYECKYTPGMADEEFPARADGRRKRARCRSMRATAFDALKLRGYARIDFRMSTRRYILLSRGEHAAGHDADAVSFRRRRRRRGSRFRSCATGSSNSRSNGAEASDGTSGGSDRGACGDPSGAPGPGRVGRTSAALRALRRRGGDGDDVHGGRAGERDSARHGTFDVSLDLRSPVAIRSPTSSICRPRSARCRRRLPVMLDTRWPASGRDRRAQVVRDAWRRSRWTARRSRCAERPRVRVARRWRRARECSMRWCVCADERTTDAHMLRIVERAHAASETTTVIVHPGAGTPVDRDRRWTTLFERASALHGDVRLALKLPPPTRACDEVPLCPSVTGTRCFLVVLYRVVSSPSVLRRFHVVSGHLRAARTPTSDARRAGAHRDQRRGDVRADDGRASTRTWPSWFGFDTAALARPLVDGGHVHVRARRACGISSPTCTRCICSVRASSTRGASQVHVVLSPLRTRRRRRSTCCSPHGRARRRVGRRVRRDDRVRHAVAGRRGVSDVRAADARAHARRRAARRSTWCWVCSVPATGRRTSNVAYFAHLGGIARGVRLRADGDVSRAWSRCASASPICRMRMSRRARFRATCRARERGDEVDDIVAKSKAIAAKRVDVAHADGAPSRSEGRRAQSRARQDLASTGSTA